MPREVGERSNVCSGRQLTIQFHDTICRIIIHIIGNLRGEESEADRSEENIEAGCSELIPAPQLNIKKKIDHIPDSAHSYD